MLVESKFYTWVDVQDAILAFFKENESNTLQNINFRIYWDGVSITYCNPRTKNQIEDLLENIFSLRLEKESDNLCILLEGNRKLPISIINVEPEDIDKLQFKPTINRPPFIAPNEAVDYKNRSALQAPIIYAFHSFKGGVGRTLHAISMALYLSERQKVLLIDADFEAPGISWLVNTPVSFADMLALIHGSIDEDEAINLVAENLSAELKEDENIYVLPAFRSPALKSPNLEIKPENIYRFNDNPFVLTDILIKLASRLKIDCILIDLRAGVSELSTGWFFDPRINKVFVTTISSQSILGTAMMFRLLSKFELQNSLRNTESPNPYLIVSQVPKSSVIEMEANWSDVYASAGLLNPLRTAYVDAFIDINDYIGNEGYKNLTDEQIVGKVIEPTTLFSEEYDSLKSLPDNWDNVIKVIRTAGLDKKLAKLSEIIPINETRASPYVDMETLRQRLNDNAYNLIFAETERQEGFLKTESIKNLVDAFYNKLPVAVVVGAKGAGKTFLFKQIGFSKDWREFVVNFKYKVDGESTILPITLPGNLRDTNDFNLVPKSLSDIFTPPIDKNIWQDYIKPQIELSLTNDLTVSQWRDKWFDYIAWAAGYKVGTYDVGREFINTLKLVQSRVVAIFDGLEDLFKQFNTDTRQQKALESLLQDVPNWLESQPERHLGIIVFVRKDIVAAAISQNSGQFLRKYEMFELKWNVEEALRLVHWVMNKYVVPEDPTFENWENVIADKKEAELIKPLYMLWGMRMAKNSSKEAYSQNWILGSLANLKKEFQSRDIIRFLYIAAKNTLAAPSQNVSLYNDRILIPSAIRDSIDEVGQSKIEEVKTENQPLKQVLELLAPLTKSIKFPCKPSEIKDIVDDKSLKILEDNGVIVMHNGEYYMAELYRKGMGFEYSRKGRPKVLYF